MELGDNMKELLKDLGQALHHALTKDQQVNAITDKIKGSGYDIYLFMETSILLDHRDSEDADFNTYDREFLTNLHIKIDD